MNGLTPMTRRKLQFFQVLPRFQGPGGGFVQPLVAQLPSVQGALTLIDPFSPTPALQTRNRRRPTA